MEVFGAFINLAWTILVSLTVLHYWKRAPRD